MEMFMPSEVARLVLGYLQENECNRTIRVYLTENSHLKEYVACLQQGHEYPTTIAGKRLIDILQEYCSMKVSAKLNENSKCSTEMRQLFNRIDSSIVQLKYLVSNGHVASGALSASLSSHSTAQKTSTRSFLLAAQKENENLRNLRSDGSALSRTSSVSTEIDNTLSNPTEERFTQTSPCGSGYAEHANAQLLEIGQLTTPSTITGSIADTPVVEHVMPSSASSLNSMECANSSCPTTPVCRSLDLYSSPSSIVKSVLLNFGMSEFQTPVKEKYLAEDGTWKTPRRKNQVPRKRLTYTPSSSTKKRSYMTTPEEPESYSSNDNVDVNALIDGLIHNTALHERIAANINNVVCNNSCQVPSSSDIGNDVNENRSEQSQLNICEQQVDLRDTVPNQVCSAHEEQMPEAVIKTIVDKTESDPMFEAFLSFLFDKQDSNSRDSPLAMGSESMPSPDTHGTPRTMVEAVSELSSMSGTPVHVINAHDTQNQSETPAVKSVVLTTVVSEQNQESLVVASLNSNDHDSDSIQQIQSSTGIENSEESGINLTNQLTTEYQQCLSDPKLNFNVASASNAILDHDSTCANSVSRQPSTSLLSSIGVPLYYTKAPSFIASSISNIPVCENSQLLNTMPASLDTCLVSPSHSVNGSVISSAPVSATALSRSCNSNANQQSDSNCRKLLTCTTVACASQDMGAFYSPSTPQTSTSQNMLSTQCPDSVTLTKDTTAISETQQQALTDKRSTNLETVSSYPVQQLSLVPTICATDQKNTNMAYTFMPIQHSSTRLPSTGTEISQVLTLDQGMTLSGSAVLQHSEDSLAQVASTTFASNQTMHITITPGKSSGYSQFLTLSPGQLHPLLEKHSSGDQSSSKSTVKMVTSDLCNATLEGAIKAITSLGNSKKLSLRKKSKKFPLGEPVGVCSAHEIINEESDGTNAAKSVTNAPITLYAAKKLDFVKEKREGISILKSKCRQGEVPAVLSTFITQTSKVSTSINSSLPHKPAGDATSVMCSELAKNQTAVGNLQITHSPQLQSLIQSAKQLKAVQKMGSHVRTLFSSPEKCENNSIVEETICCAADPPRKNTKPNHTLRKGQNSQKRQESNVKSTSKGLGVLASEKLQLSSSNDTGISNFYPKNKKKSTVAKIAVTSRKGDKQRKLTSITVRNEALAVESEHHLDEQMQASVNLTSRKPKVIKDGQPPKKKSRTEGSQDVLSAMDVEKFLSGLQYVE